MLGVRRAFRDITESITKLIDRNRELEDFSRKLVCFFLDEAERQDMCNRECPAYLMCKGSQSCMFAEWALGRAMELGVSDDDS